MLSPKRTKYRKAQKGNNRGTARRGSDVSFGDFAMQAVEPGRVDVPPDRGGAHGDHPPREARRQALDPHLPGRPVTKKPLEVRMGGGKGDVEEWAAQSCCPAA